MTRHAGVSWFDMSGGWFAGQPMLDMFRRQMRIAPAMFAKRKHFVADVALFIDENSTPYFRPVDLLRHMITDTIAKMPQAGITWDFYLLSDATAPNLPRYKLYVVLNGARMSRQTRRALMAHAAKNGATVLLMYAPGGVSDQDARAAAITRATGMNVTRVGPGPGEYRIVAPAGLDACGGLATKLDPRFAITDLSAVALARWTDGAGVAIARKTIDGVPVVYCAAVSMPPALWRQVAKSAGAMIYCDSGDSIYADHQYIALYATTDGLKTLHLPVLCHVTDMITGRRVPWKTDRIQRRMKVGQTIFLRLGNEHGLTRTGAHVESE